LVRKQADKICITQQEAWLMEQIHTNAKAKKKKRKTHLQISLHVFFFSF
jgi:ribosomal protein L32